MVSGSSAVRAQWSVGRPLRSNVRYATNSLSGRDNRQDEVCRVLGVVQDGLIRDYHPIARVQILAGVEITIPVRKIATRDLQPNLVTGLKTVAHLPQNDPVFVYFSGFNELD